MEGHWDVVEYLHENRTEGCSAATIHFAKRRDHLDIVSYNNDLSSRSRNPHQSGMNRRSMKPFQVVYRPNYAVQKSWFGSEA